MTDLAVPIEMLEGFAGEVSSIRTRMNATGQTFENYEDDVGDDRVKSALESFVSNWKDGRKEIDGQLEAIKEITDTILQTFDELETDLEAGLEGDGSEGGGDPNGPV
jgi:hypothetical protein